MAAEDRQSLENVRRAIAGDMNALEWLMFQFHDDVRRHVASRIRPNMKPDICADDILQNAFIQAFQRIGGCRGDSVQKFVSWLKMIAERKLIDQIRKLDNGTKAATELNDSYRQLAKEIADSLPTPSRRVAKGEAIAALRQAIAALPQKYGQAIQLYYIESRPLDDVARVMEQSPGAVRGFIYRAKIELRNIMGSSSLYLSTK